MSITKNCNYCFQEKDISLFCKGRNKCKDCNNAYRAAYKEDIKNGVKRVKLVKSSLPQILCLKCRIIKDSCFFRKGKLTCKDCVSKNKEEHNQKKKQEYLAGIFSNKLLRKCKTCDEEKTLDNFYLTGYRCNDCKNSKPDRLAEKHKLKLQEWEKAANEPKQCVKCNEIKLKSDFRIDSRVCKKCRANILKEKKLKKNPPPPAKELQYELNSDGQMEQVKCCIRCKKAKFNSEFVIRKKNFTKNYCKECQNERTRVKYHQKRRENGLPAGPLRIGKARFTDLQRRERMLEGKRKEYRLNKEKIQARNREYKKKNRHKFNEYHKRKRETDPAFNLECKIRTRIRRAFIASNCVKSLKSKQLLGCSIQEAKDYISSKFEQGMSWEKVISGEIEIDHIIPCALFDLSDIDEQKRCFNYKNLFPLWKKVNNSKLDFYAGIQWKFVPKSIKKISKLKEIVEELNHLD